MTEDIHEEPCVTEFQPGRVRPPSSRWTWIGWGPGKIARQRASDGALAGGHCTAGYDAVLIPVDGQSARLRDIDDDSPLCVTILLRRKQDR